MQLTELFIITMLVIIAWFWLDSTKVLERARSVGAKMCLKNQVQFLDDTVHQSKFRFGKNSYGQLKFVRTYKFEFTNNEYQRYRGELVFAGYELISSEMEAYRIESVDQF